MSDAAALGHEDAETRQDEPGLRVPFSAARGARGASGDDAAGGAGVSHAGAESHSGAESRAVESRARVRRSRLTKLLLAKLTLDLLFVASLAVYSHAVAFNPFYSGSLDYADGRSVRGWVVDRAEPGRAVEVQLYIDGRFFAAGVADQPRPDVSEKGYAADERHGFVFNFERDLYGEHEARVYALHTSRGETRRTLQQIGSPIRFARK
jgi:hypothetical protein